jgi:glycine C-acetyltransferase
MLMVCIKLRDFSLQHNRLLAEEIYVMGFSFPLVPKGQTGIRRQILAAHTKEQLDQAITTFIKMGKG